MTIEWTELPDLQAVAKAQADGWEIEVKWNADDGWNEWGGTERHFNCWFRARPKQPKMKTVKSLCWRHCWSGAFKWTHEECPVVWWQRFPAGDIEEEVPDDN